MSCISPIAPAAAIILVSYVVAPAASSPVTTQVRAASGVEGSWTGAPFASAEWTFEFKQEGDGWSGRYMGIRFNKWHELQSVTVSGNSVTFAIKSEPVLRFDLEVEAGGQSISGTMSIGNGLTRPFSAVRRS